MGCVEPKEERLWSALPAGAPLSLTRSGGFERRNSTARAWLGYAAGMIDAKSLDLILRNGRPTTSSWTSP